YTSQVIDANSGQILWSGSGYGVAVNQNGSRYAICDSQGGFELTIMDASFDSIYQDDDGCQGVFSADGQTFYRDVTDTFGNYTQALDMTTFGTRDVPNYFTADTGEYGAVPTVWAAADATGMVYGINPNNGQKTFTNPSVSALWIAQDMAATSTPQLPASSNSIKILHLIDTVGSPQGGDTIRLLCICSGATSLTIGGAAATNLSSLTTGAGGNTFIPGEALLTATTPPGTPGLADVVLSGSGGSDTAPKGFQYAQSRTIFPFATSPNFLVYDELRKRLYAAHQNQVEVIDVVGQTVLTPLVPVQGKLQNSQFAGLSLSPDGNRLYIADYGAAMVHELDLTNPGTGYSVNAPEGMYPGRVYELSNGQIVGCDGDSENFNLLFFVDPTTGSATYFPQSTLGTLNYTWGTTNSGENVLVSGQALNLWNAASSSTLLARGLYAPALEYTANQDNTAIAAGNSNQYSPTNPEIIDFNLNPLGYVDQHFDVSMPANTPGLTLHPSGALLYQPGISTLSGDYGNVVSSTVEMDDLHLWQPAGSVVFPEPFITSNDSITNHLFTTDSTGQYLFGVTQSGITMMVLGSAPLSIGNIQPASVQPQGGQTVTLRGSGFQSGATVSIGGTEATTTFVDANTLTLVTPALALGEQDVTVTLPSGVTYTAPSLLTVEAPQSAPVITGFSPTSFVIQATVGATTTGTVTILGSGFNVNDTVEINGSPVPSEFLDSGDIQATIPASLTGTSGFISATVIPQNGGSSNTLTLPMVNPVPILEDNPPITIVPNGTACLNLYGTGFVPGAAIQLNGQSVSTSLNAQGSPAGLEVVSGCVSVGSSGPATLTVLNPSPGGGESNALTIDVSAAHPLLQLFEYTPIAISNPYVSSFPASVNLGSVPVNTPTTYTFFVYNIGTANYVFSSATVPPGPFSVSNTSCVPIPPPPGSAPTTCAIYLTFTPTSAGPASANLTIVDNTPTSPNIVTFTGTGLQPSAPTVTLISVTGGSTSANIAGNAVVGGTTVPGTAWVEYGTDPSLATFTATAPTSFTGNQAVYASISGLASDTVYAVRFAVQTAAGTGKSAIHLFATTSVIPSVKVTPSPSSVTASQEVIVAVSVVTGSGNPAPTGTVSLTSGTYTSAAVTLNSGNASITIPSGSLVAGGNALSVTYTPDTTSSSFYKSATGMAWETVTLSTPTVSVTPSLTNISTAQSLSIQVSVGGSPTPTGAVTLTGGGYTSPAATLSGGVATINIPAGSLSTGTDLLTVTFTPDAQGSSIYNSASGSTSVTVSAEPAAAIPTFSVPQGTYNSAQSVAISDTTPGASIYYAINGTPVAGVNPYTGAITVSSSETLEAIAVASSYTNSAVASATYTINPPPPTFSIPSLSTTALTLSSGGQGTITITVTPQNGFTGTITFACSGLPVGASCVFNPTTITPPATTSTTLTVTAQTLTSSLRRISNPILPGITFALSVCLFGWRRRRGLQLLMLAGICLAGLTLLSGCGGGSSNCTGNNCGGGNQTSTVTVTATSGSIVQATTFSLTVD
ncbi:MAG: IPT/TIG domain-containing protein, partial [Terracidiphilus sp.]